MLCNIGNVSMKKLIFHKIIKNTWHFKSHPKIKEDTFLWYIFDYGCAEMSKINLLLKAIDVVSSSIRNYEFLCLSRNDPKYFTRKGKIGFVNLITFTLNFVRKSLQLEIDSFSNLSILIYPLQSKLFPKRGREYHMIISR